MQPENTTLPSIIFKLIFIELSVAQENVRECKVSLLIKDN